MSTRRRRLLASRRRKLKRSKKQERKMILNEKCKMLLSGLKEKYIVFTTDGEYEYKDYRTGQTYDSKSTTLNLATKYEVNGVRQYATINIQIVDELKKIYINVLSNYSDIKGLGADLLYSVACAANSIGYTLELYSAPSIAGRDVDPERLHQFYTKVGMNRNDTMPVNVGSTMRGFVGNPTKIINTPYFNERLEQYSEPRVFEVEASVKNVQSMILGLNQEVANEGVVDGENVNAGVADGENVNAGVAAENTIEAAALRQNNGCWGRTCRRAKKALNYAKSVFWRNNKKTRKNRR